MRRPLAVAMIGLLVPAGACAQTEGRPSGPVDLENAEAALAAGRYEEAIEAYRTLVEDPAAHPEAPRGLARALGRVGRYEEGIEALERARETAEGAGARALQIDRALGELLAAVGRVEEAEARFRAAIAGGASDAPLAELGLALLLRDRGRRDEARRLFEGLIDLYNRSAGLDAPTLLAVGTAVSHLGARDPQLFHDAVRAYEEAIEAAPEDPDPRVALGELFLAKYDSRTAGELFAEALARDPTHPGALLGLARRARFDGSSESLEHAERALRTNPNFVAARAFRARLFLDLEDETRAETEARRALEVNPRSLEAWTALAGVAHLRGDRAAFDEARERVLALDPFRAELYDVLAEVAYRNHRYAEAVGFARRGVERDSLSWSSRAQLGLNLLRVGRMEEGRATLEAAFAGDPFNVWVKNTLDLLDELERFDLTESPRFRIWTHEQETGLLTLYATELAERAFERLAARYAYEPPTPVRLELYDREADFSVRTVGTTEFGALGVSFGSVLAMVSPGARDRGTFNWGSTLWHEVSHAFTLGLTEHRVPRWLSEGLAVLDERRAREAWGADVSPDFLVAFREGRLPTLERFNYGFVRPSYPRQVQHSYFLASLLCEMIEDERGFDAIRRMLEGYREGLETREVFRRALGADVEAMDARLRRYVEERFADGLAAVAGLRGREGRAGPDAAPGAPPAAADPDGFFGRLAEGAALVREGRLEEAIPPLERAKALFPAYSGPDAPALLLARAHAELGAPERAAAELRHYTAIAETHYEALLELAELEDELSRPAAAAAALEAALWIDPYDPELHERLAALYEATGDARGAVRERRAVLALGPADRAAALFRLARAYRDAGRSEEARGTVLDALEIAPGYEDALELLLELREGEPER